jgi:predicted membrane protein
MRGVPVNESLLVWSLLFGSLGLGFFIYGRRQRAVVPLLCGLALMIVPNFMSSTLALVALCSVLVFIPYFIRI